MRVCRYPSPASTVPSRDGDGTAPTAELEKNCARRIEESSLSNQTPTEGNVAHSKSLGGSIEPAKYPEQHFPTRT